MTCDCIKKINSLLQKRLNDSAEVNTAIMMNDGTLRVVVNGLYHKKNAKGEYQKKWSEVNIQADYCPFCGKPYKEEKQ